MVEAAAAAAGFTIDVKAEATDLVTLTDLVAQGIGVGVFPESVAVRARGQLVAIPLIRPRLKRHLVLVWHRQRTSAVAKAFLEVAQAVDDGTRR
jgi:DNA-binding transcriptional LysR family regulator